MADVQINYTHKLATHYDPHERIIGVAGDGGGGWFRRTDLVVQDLNTGQNSYYVMVDGDRADVIVASHNGRPYIKTRPDGDTPNNLLALPEPPARLIP